MDQILTNLTQLKGVHDAYIYQDGDLHTSEPSKKASMFEASQTIEQIFIALSTSEKSHNEIYFSLGNKYLISYLFENPDSNNAADNKTIVSLLTEKKINFPLIHMGVKTAFNKLVSLKKELEARAVAPAPVPNIINEQPQIAAIPKTAPVSAFEIDTYVKPLSDLLIEYLGPAAPFVVEDAVTAWKKKYVQSRDNLPELITLIEQELETDDEKKDYRNKSSRILTAN